jgi:hypothetical protein
MTIILKNTSLTRKSKTTWNVEKTDFSEISVDVYNSICDSCKFMRRLRGTETVLKNYTCRGYRVVKIVSTSPCKSMRTIREFQFQ